MIWSEDKKLHYKYCYNITKKFPKYLRVIPFLGVVVFGFLKEIKDFFTKNRFFDLNDHKANIIGSFDALTNKKSMFE